MLRHSGELSKIYLYNTMAASLYNSVRKNDIGFLMHLEEKAPQLWEVFDHDMEAMWAEPRLVDQMVQLFSVCSRQNMLTQAFYNTINRDVHKLEPLMATNYGKYLTFLQNYLKSK